MAEKDSIIDHRNIGGLYTTWTILLAINFLLAVLIYWLQYTTAFITNKSLNLIFIFIGVSIVLIGFSFLFKYKFKREVISWLAVEIIMLFGFTSFLLYGWHWAFYIFFVTAVFFLFVLGPYLHFD